MLAGLGLSAIKCYAKICLAFLVKLPRQSNSIQWLKIKRCKSSTSTHIQRILSTSSLPPFFLSLQLRASPTRVSKTHTHTQNPKISSPTNKTQNPKWVPTSNLTQNGRKFGEETHYYSGGIYTGHSCFLTKMGIQNDKNIK